METNSNSIEKQNETVKPETIENPPIVQGGDNIEKQENPPLTVEEIYQKIEEKLQNKFTEIETSISDILKKQSSSETSNAQSTTEKQSIDPLIDMGERVRIITAYSNVLGDNVDYEDSSTELKRKILKHKFFTDKKAQRELDSLSDENVYGCFYFMETYYEENTETSNIPGLFNGEIIQPITIGK
ncbi:MAG: hypothetical protein F6K34_01065 [Okeania sp. SIO4D6]|nr:hypothetical protein [Okeania sp. SIO4D6]